MEGKWSRRFSNALGNTLLYLAILFTRTFFTCLNIVFPERRYKAYGEKIAEFEYKGRRYTVRKGREYPPDPNIWLNLLANDIEKITTLHVYWVEVGNEVGACCTNEGTQYLSRPRQDIYDLVARAIAEMVYQSKQPMIWYTYAVPKGLHQRHPNLVYTKLSNLLTLDNYPLKDKITIGMNYYTKGIVMERYMVKKVV